MSQQPFRWGVATSRVACPVLLIAGNADRGSLVSAENLTRAVDAAGSRITAVIIDQAGHNIRRDDLEAFDITIRSYLRITESRG